MTGYGPLAIWGVAVALGVGTYAIRLSFIHLLGRVDGVPPRLQRPLEHVPPAVLSALVAPELVTVRATPAATLMDPRLAAAGVAAAVAWRTGDVLWTIAAGLGTLWLLTFVVL